MSDFENQLQWTNEDGEVLGFEQMHELAVKGYINAMIEIAFVYRNEESYKDNRKALHWFEKAGGLYCGNPAVVVEMGCICLDLMDYNCAIMYLENASNEGNEKAELMLIVAHVKSAEAELEWCNDWQYATSVYRMKIIKEFELAWEQINRLNQREPSAVHESILEQQYIDVAIGMGLLILIPLTALAPRDGVSLQAAINWFKKAAEAGSVFGDAMLTHSIFCEKPSEETAYASDVTAEKVQAEALDSLTPFRKCILYLIKARLGLCYNNFDYSYEHFTLANDNQVGLSYFARNALRQFHKKDDGHWEFRPN
jgi:TPR repeat protein